MTLETTASTPGDDRRLYVPHPDGWTAEIKRSADKEYCFFKHPGDDYYHLLGVGELYLQRNDEKYCLNCALRHGELTPNRLHWKRGD